MKRKVKSFRCAAADLWRRTPPVWRYSFGLFLASQAGAALNMFTSLFYLPARLDPADLGAVDPIVRLMSVGAIPLAVVGQVGVKYLSAFQARGETGKIKLFLRDMALLASAAALVFSVILLALYPAVSLRLHVAGAGILAGMLALLVVSVWQPVLTVMLQGTQRFGASMALSILQPALLLAAAAALVPRAGLSGFLGARFVAGLAPVIVGMVSLRNYLGRRVAMRSYYAEWRELWRYTWPMALLVSSGWLQQFIESLVVRHWLPRMDSAGFYMAFRLGGIPMVLVGCIRFVIFPMLSHRHERGESTRAIFRQAWWGTLIIGGLGTAALGLGARWILDAYGPWRVFLPYASWVAPIGAVLVMDALNATYATHEAARRRFYFLAITAPVAVAQAVGLYALFGWGALSGIIPAPIWQWVHENAPRTLGAVVAVMAVARLLTMALLALHGRRPSARRKFWRSGGCLR